VPKLPNVPSVLARPVAAAALASRDGGRVLAHSVLPSRTGAAEDALDAAIAWLCRTHDVTGRLGSSKGFSLVRGWLPAYPETTGYVIGTLLAYARRCGGRADLVERAREMGDWGRALQQRDGGVMEGTVGGAARRSIVFNTGMVLHGWMDLQEAGFEGYEPAAARAAGFLRAHLGADGMWDPRVEYAGLPHTYNARVAWAMLRWARRTADDRTEEAARRHLDWVISRQRPNGWFDDCVFRTGMKPSTHGLAYTLRGLLESYAVAGEERWLRTVERTSESLIRKLEVQVRLAAAYDADWRPATSHACLTGIAQLGGVWLRLHRVAGDPRWLNAGLKAVEQAAGHQERGPWRDIRGALAGSFPIWGRYAPLQYPNWATKFLADALMLYEDELGREHA
jgi:hypothetical protein